VAWNRTIKLQARLPDVNLCSSLKLYKSKCQQKIILAIQIIFKHGFRINDLPISESVKCDQPHLHKTHSLAWVKHATNLQKMTSPVTMLIRYRRNIWTQREWSGWFVELINLTRWLYILTWMMVYRILPHGKSVKGHLHWPEITWKLICLIVSSGGFP